MPRDARLYMTFPIDFDEHPKIELLSDAAFRAFVAMNGYSRRQRLDGKIPAAIATKRWGRKVLTELLGSHEERPLVLLEAETYILRSYADHQFTTEDEEALRSARAIAGAKGGKAKANALAIAKQTAGKNVAGSESRLETGQTDDGNLSPYVTEVDAGEADETEFVRELAEKAGIRDLGRVRVALERAVGSPLPSDAHAIDLAQAVLGLSKTHVKSAEAYIEKAALNSPGEIRDRWAAVLAVIA